MHSRQEQSRPVRKKAWNTVPAKEENGVLHFTGGGYISVVPKNLNGGTLYVQMEKAGECKTQAFVIDVVEKHNCHAEEWTILIEPSETEDGYAVKQCTVCEDVLDVKKVSCCATHTYGTTITETEATEDAYGLAYKECSTCGYKEYTWIMGESELSAKGDINGDGNIRMNDLVLLCMHLNTGEALTEQVKRNADINGDGQIKMNDAVLLFQYLSLAEW